MKKAFIITTAIDVDTTRPLTYSTTRSSFSQEERLRQTIYTVDNVDHISGDQSTIFLLDISENWNSYRDSFRHQPNLIYIPVKEIFPEIFNTIRTHPNKSVGESVLLSSFLDRCAGLLGEFDYCFKVSGRYFISKDFSLDLLNDSNRDKLFFKQPWQFEFQDHWNYRQVDLRQQQGNNYLYQYPTTIFGWGSGKYQTVLDIFKKIAQFIDQPDHYQYDIETMIYYYTRPYAQDIVQLNCSVRGWDSVSGQFRNY